jgi:hypothetical protein
MASDGSADKTMAAAFTYAGQGIQPPVEAPGPRRSRRWYRARLSCRVEALLDGPGGGSAEDPAATMVLPPEDGGGKQRDSPVTPEELNLFEAGGSESELGWQLSTLLALREAVKTGLHTRGLGLRHCALIQTHLASLAEESASIGTLTTMPCGPVVRLCLAASTLPRPGSPTSLSLEQALTRIVPWLCPDMASWRAGLSGSDGLADAQGSASREPSGAFDSASLSVLVAGLLSARAMACKGRAASLGETQRAGRAVCELPGMALHWLRAQASARVSAPPGKLCAMISPRSLRTPPASAAARELHVAQLRNELEAYARCGYPPETVLITLRRYIDATRMGNGTFPPDAIRAALKGLALCRQWAGPRQLEVWAMLASSVLTCTGYHTCAFEISNGMGQFQATRGCSGGPQHVVSRASQAFSLVRQGLFDRALAEYTSCAETMAGLLDKTPHPALATLYANIASCNRQLGKPKVALVFNRLARELYAAAGVSEHHPCVLETDLSQCGCLLDLRQPMRATRLLEELGPMLFDSFGPDHMVLKRHTVLSGRALCETAVTSRLKPSEPSEPPAPPVGGAAAAAAAWPVGALDLPTLLSDHLIKKQVDSGVAIARAGYDAIAKAAGREQLDPAEAASHLAVCLSMQGALNEAWSKAVESCRGYMARLGVLHPCVRRSLRLVVQLALRSGNSVTTKPLVASVYAKLARTGNKSESFTAELVELREALDSLTEATPLDEA